MEEKAAVSRRLESDDRCPGGVSMNYDRLVASVRPWIESRLGISLSEAGADPIPVVAASPQRSDLLPLRAVRIGDSAVVVARPSWVQRLQPIVGDLHADLLFSVFGAYEIARVTLPDGVGVWGPSWYLFADEASPQTIGADLAARVDPSELVDVDWDIFWHCFPDEALAGFAVVEENRVAALATVRDEGEPVWEIGMDVAPDARGRGLGRAVVGAAMRWILDTGRMAMANVGPFNVPSARTLRAVGLRYVLSDMKGVEGPFKVPPQPLGRPYGDVELHDYYPAWAMNHDILRR